MSERIIRSEKTNGDNVTVEINLNQPPKVESYISTGYTGARMMNGVYHYNGCTGCASSDTGPTGCIMLYSSVDFKPAKR